MAPVTATAAGIARQTIDDPQLVSLLGRLSAFWAQEVESKVNDAGAMAGAGDDGGDDEAMADQSEETKKRPPLDVEAFVAELDRWPSWRFQEQADLYEWIRPLNAMDATLSYFLEAYPSLLLIAPISAKEKKFRVPAESAADASSVPSRVIQSVRTLLRFLSHLLRNATNKSVFNSVSYLVDLLSAADDGVAALALECLSNLAVPPMLHRQQAPEVQQHSTALHTAPTAGGAHRRLLALARGWGSRGSGLGLSACVSADDSVRGQGTLPRHGGELRFEYWPTGSTQTAEQQREAVGDGSDSAATLPTSEAATAMEVAGSSGSGGGPAPSSGVSGPSSGGDSSSRLVSIYLSADEIRGGPLGGGSSNEGSNNGGGSSTSVMVEDTTDDDDSAGSKQKRRRTTSPSPHRSTSSTATKSTPELFFRCLEQAGGRANVPIQRQFPLLVEVRLARSFYSRQSRIGAVERRLRALVAVLHSHPSQDIMAGYFHAQPELCAELVDLVRPTVSNAAVSASSPLATAATTAGSKPLLPSDAGRVAGISPIGDPSDSSVPYSVRTLAVEALTALVARRDGANGGGLTNVARQANVLGELGVGKGQYLGLLPTLIRYSLASLNSFLSHGTTPSTDSAKPLKSEEDGTTTADAMIIDGDSDGLGLSLGLAFLEATRAPPLPRREQEERALEFIDAVLTLTSAVVSVPAGTAALTDCGLVPALVSTVALDSYAAQKDGGGRAEEGDKATDKEVDDDLSYSACLLKFITAQAIQIIEGAIVTHNNALSAFHDLHGVDLLVTRLYVEVEKVRRDGGETGSLLSTEAKAAATMDVEGDGGSAMVVDGDSPEVAKVDTPARSTNRPLRAARRVLLFSIVNCLTVVFHQQESSSSSSAPSGGAQLRKPELTAALIDVMDNVSSYGGVLAALTATLLSDVMNGDPQVVHHVHKSGLAKSFLSMMMGKEEDRSGDEFDDEWRESTLPASSELIMAIPNVIAALALTEDGARSIRDTNPFPAMLSVFCSPKYAMPQSRCLLSEMTAIVGTGLDEIMRHVPSLRPLVMKALVSSIRRVVFLGKKLGREEVEDEISGGSGTAPADEPGSAGGTPLENSRSCLMQYAFNFGQLLEQILHNEEHSPPFVDAGGLDALLELHPLLMPASARQFLSHASCMSCPSVANLTHSTTTSTIAMAIKSVALNYEPQKMLKKVGDKLRGQLDLLEKCRVELRRAAVSSGESDPVLAGADSGWMDLCGILDGVPCVPLHRLSSTPANDAVATALASYLRNVATTEWLTNVLSAVVRCACQRSHERGTGWGRDEREWQKEVSSKSFEAMVRRLSSLHRHTLLEVCRVRTEEGFESRDLARRSPPGEGGDQSSHPAAYRLRIVCPEGAVVRDGIEIDSCASVGGLEMGEVVNAYDRCVNSSGVMRYRTTRGWVSEQTRGHGREPIAEVLSVSGVAKKKESSNAKKGEVRQKGKKGERIECGLPDLCAASASVMARLHNSHTGLLSCLSRAVVQGVRSLPLRSLSFQQGTVGAHVGALVRTMSDSLREGFDVALSQGQVGRVLEESREGKVKEVESLGLTDAGVAMYLGSTLNLLHSCLYDEKRERQRTAVNLPLLINLVTSAGWEPLAEQNATDEEGGGIEKVELPTSGFFAAVRFVLKTSLRDMSELASKEEEDRAAHAGAGADSHSSTASQRLSRATAASLPPTLSLLRRLMSRTLLVDSQMSSILGRMKIFDLRMLVGEGRTDLSKRKKSDESGDDSASFHQGRFARSLHCVVADAVFEMWTDPRMTCSPAHVVHPVVALVSEIFGTLDADAKAAVSDDGGPDSGSGRARSGSQGELISDLQQRLSRNISAMNAFLDESSARPGADGEGGDGGGGGDPPPPPPHNWFPRPPEPFEPNEETVSRLTEMGFSREHALEALETTESNRVEVAMEYALSHPPPSPTTVERRRAAREERRRQREERQARAAERASRARSPTRSASAADADAEEQATDENASGSGAAAAAPRDSSATEAMDVDEVDGVPTPTPQPGQGDAAADGTSKPAAAKKKEKTLTEEEKKALRQKELEARSAAQSLKCLNSWKEQVTPIALSIIAAGGSGVKETSQILKPLSGDNNAIASVDGEAEALTVVICSFLLELCERYPADRSKIVAELLRRLKSYICTENGGATCSITASCESDFAALCHATVVFTRALPRTRPLVLRNGVVGSLLLCIQSLTFVPKDESGDVSPRPGWPIWLSPALLLLDIMAQPTAAPLEGESEDGDIDRDQAGTKKVGSSRGEFARVCSEHKKQAAHLSKTAQGIFDALNNKTSPSAKKKRKNREKGKENKKQVAKKQDESKEDEKKANASSAEKGEQDAEESESKSAGSASAPTSPVPFSKIPPYLPLMPSDSAELCMNLCLRLLGRGRSGDGGESGQKIPPGVVHSTLLLLTRLLRSHKLASLCLRMGGAELVLGLPGECRFAGNTGLVTVVLRRLLEDEATLQTAMETEIRGTVAKIYKKQNRGSSGNDDERPRVNSKSFIQAMTPLICRDPLVFVKAVATSVRFEVASPDVSGGGSRQTRVVLLSAEERAKNVKILSEHFGAATAYGHNSSAQHSSAGTKQNTSTHKRGRASLGAKVPPGARTSKSKSPHRSSVTKRGSSPKKPRREKRDRSAGAIPHESSKKFIALNGTPANHVTSLLLTQMMALAVGEEQRGSSSSSHNGEKLGGTSFLWIMDYLEVLADLVLAVPACAAAIHRYRPPSGKQGGKVATNSLRHALSGCRRPPNTAVSFLLHNLLPQTRVASPKSNQESWDSQHSSGSKDPDVLLQKKKEAYKKVKIAQTTARLLVALVARAGEGRRRVVADLAFALSGGGNGQTSSTNGGSDSSGNVQEDDHEMWALQAWGELCIGLAAPRSSSVNHDNNNSLSFEVVKLMMECGMAHALMHGIQKVKLHHPMAAGAAGSLLRPMEVFTRGSVVDTIQEMAEKEEAEKKKASKAMDLEASSKSPKKKSGSEPTLTRRITIGPSQRSEGSFADDAALEDAFDADTAERNARRHRRRDLYEEVDEEELEELQEYSDEEMDDEEDVDGDDDAETDDASSDEESTDEDVSDDDGMEVPLSGDESEGSSEDEEGSEGTEEGESMEEPQDDEEEEVEAESEAGDEEEGEDEEEEPEDEDDHNRVWDGEDDFLIEDEEREAEEGGMAGLEDVGEGWTRIDQNSSGFGRMLFGVRQSSGGSSDGNQATMQNARTRGFIIDAAEAMIGNILRAGDIQMEALAEIEDTLGIRIMHHRAPSEGDSDPPQRSRTWGRSDSARSGISGGEGLSSSDRGTIGTVPSVYQTTPPDSGYSVSASGRWGEVNPMEYVYGGPSIAAGSRNYDLAAAARDDDEVDLLPVPTNVDTQLFPGGPAASTHSRTQQRLHPLLCGVELPPLNSLVSALTPHGLRSTSGSRASQHNSSDWGSGPVSTGGFISSANGNIIRLNRGPSGGPILEHHSSRGSGGGVGGGLAWTDDGQPLDSTTGEYSLAIEQALGEAMAPTPAVEEPSSGDAPNPSSTGSAEAASSRSTQVSAAGSDMDVSASANPSQESDAPAASSATEAGQDGATADGAEGSLVQQTDSVQMEEVANSSSSSAEAPSSNTNSGSSVSGNNEGNNSEGEAVASSLAAGLTLSPRSESSTTSDPAPTSQAPADESAPSQPNAVANGSEPPPSSGQQQTNESMETENQGEESSSADVTGQNESADQTPSPATDGGDGRESAPPGENASSANDGQAQQGTDESHRCPPGMDLEVFNSLPFEMQQEVIEQHQATANVAAQLDSASGLDPEALAALPEEMRREVIAQEQQERQMREQAPADPSNAEEMDNASFVASLAPDLREEILLTADDTFLNSLPPNIIAEATILRERASSQHRRMHEEAVAAASSSNTANAGGQSRSSSSGTHHVSRSGSASTSDSTPGGTSSKKRNRFGKIRVECDRSQVVYSAAGSEKESTPLMTVTSLKALIRLMYLLSPVRPQRLLQKLIQNLCATSDLRRVFLAAFVSLLNDDPNGAVAAVNVMGVVGVESEEPSGHGGPCGVDIIGFPPPILIGTAPEVLESDGLNLNLAMFRRRHGSSCAAAIAANLPASARGSSHDEYLPPVVARRIIDTLSFLSKNAPKVSLDMLSYADEMDEAKMPAEGELTCLDRLLDLLGKPLYCNSSTNLEQLLNLLESVVAPLSYLPRDGDRDVEISKKELDAAAAMGKEWVNVPRAVVSQRRLHLLCSTLRMESCKDSSFVKVNAITRRLCRVEANRACILRELASVAQGLGADAIRDLRSLSIRLDDAVKLHQGRLLSTQALSAEEGREMNAVATPKNPLLGGIPSSAVTLSTSSSELKLLRVLQTLHALCGESSHDESGGRKNDGSVVVTQELVSLLQSINLEALWEQLTSCLRVVSVLEGVAHVDESEEKKGDEGENGSDGEQDDGSEGHGATGKKLQNSVAGLLTRFLPTIEAFFVVNASSTGDVSGAAKASNEDSETGRNTEQDVQQPSSSASPAAASIGKHREDADLDSLVGGKHLVEFVATNKILLNALLRNNPALLEKGLRAMVQVRRCRPFLDFDVKRQWFKTQVRRLRNYASRRHGSLRLNIRRKHVFEDAYHQLRLRNADEMRGRLHITFKNEEGVDAGGLSREFFGILAKEMFNPNYALFTSTEDGCTFQPNPNSSINPDHLSYFRFVGRIVGKAVADGFLLDAHFTRSLYKHMLGVKPTHHDMEAIDPDYYKNLKLILEYNLADIGLDLTFSTMDHSFGRNQTIDLIPNGRSTAVTDETKAKYVSLVCQHRMTTAIEKQIKAYLDGFYELVKPDLISIFTAKELELLISGMPEIDIDDLKRNTDYQGYKATDKEIGWFWSIMFTLSRSEKAAFLQFVTGSSKVPLAGFSELQGMRGVQKFSIHKAGGSSGALMSAHTCFNSLDLPVYNSEEEMREKLLYAISEGGGGFLFA